MATTTESKQMAKRAVTKLTACDKAESSRAYLGCLTTALEEISIIDARSVGPDARNAIRETRANLKAAITALRTEHKAHVKAVRSL